MENEWKETEPGPYSMHRFAYKGWEVCVNATLTGNRRITIAGPGSMSLDYNWCAGPEAGHAKVLLGLAKRVIDLDFPRIAYYNEPKPYYKDLKFVQRMNEIGYEPMEVELTPTIDLLKILTST